ncbi:MAG: Mrp/NBP35 family ATP-binding protein [Candidatus Bathyarchaeia archaeon]
MPTPEQIVEAVKVVKDPEIHVSIVDLDMVRDVVVDGGKVNMTIALTVSNCPLTKTIDKDVTEAALTVPGVSSVEIMMTSMTKEEREGVFRKLGRKGIERMEKAHGIKHMIAVTSGKGGVGKSVVAALLASDLKRQGYDVGILDSDVTGPSGAKIMGVQAATQGTQKVAPGETASGIQVMSMQLLLKNPDDPVIWRGPILHNVITQMYKEIEWRSLDYLIVDVPPGTSDVPLTLYQTFPLDGIVVVATPQDLVTMIVRKAINMARQMKVPILGLIENMSFATCSNCGEPMHLWGPSTGQNIAKNVNIPFLGALPIDPKIATLCDKGEIENYQSAAFPEIARRLLISQMAASKATFLDWSAIPKAEPPLTS